MIGTVALFALAESLRYAVLTWRKRVHGLSFFKQDAVATLLFFTAIGVLRQITGSLNITPGLSSWAEAAGFALG
jgi:hypothetical protein